MNEKKCSKETELALLKQIQEHQNLKIDDIHRAIVGNGKPGLRDEMSQLQGALKFSQIIFGIIISIITLITVFL